MANTLSRPHWRLGRLWPVLLAQYATRALFGLLLAWPLARLLSDPTASLPRGDRVLFDDGATYLAEAIRLRRPEMTAVGEGLLGMCLLVGYAGLLPLAALLAALTAARPETLSDLLSRAWRAMGALSLLLGTSLVAVAFAATLPEVVFGLLEDKVSGPLGDVRHDLVEGVLRVVGALAIALVAVVHDLARVAAVRDERGALSALGGAWCAFRQRPLSASLGWCASALAGASLMGLAALVSAHAGVETAIRFAAVFALHQAVILALILVRAAWLTRARDLLPAPPVLVGSGDVESDEDSRGAFG